MPNRNVSKRNRTSEKILIVSYIATVISISAILISAYALFHSVKTVYLNKTVYVNGTVKTSGPASYKHFNITSSLITPAFYLPKDPVITTSAPVGSRLTDINQPLNASQLSIINNASDSYFEEAGALYLNGSLSDVGGVNVNNIPPFIVNGKPSVIYLGSITCIFCGENRWAMALALSRFGNFSQLYQGYSSLHDGDLPTLYWAPAQYNQSGDDLGSFYNSKYINFIAIEDANPITGGFLLNSLSEMRQNINYTGNIAYEDAFSYILNLSNVAATSFQGTPYTIWGTSQVGGADAVDVGAQENSTYALAYMSHEQVLQQLADPTSQFALTEYAAADLYVAMTCASLNNTVPVCKLPSILKIEKQNGY